MKEIEITDYYFITGINEPEENSLVFELVCGIIADKEENIFWQNQYIASAYPILMNENCRYRIKFDNYIGYSVLDESYANKLGDDFIGHNPRIYTHSNFLNYIETDTFATKDYPSEFRHYAFLSENHVLNVVSISEPEIEKIK